MALAVRCLASLTLILLWIPPAMAWPDKPAKADEELVKKVWTRIVAVTEPKEGFAWPPTCTLENVQSINAYATVDVSFAPPPEGEEGAKAKGRIVLQPKVVVFRGMMEQIIRTPLDKDLDAAADRLAYILGHEMSHITLGHIFRDRAEKTPLVKLVFGRDHEIAADVKGAELALKAGFSLRRGLESIRRMQKMGLEYSSFEGLGADHPSWNDRLVHLDREQAGLWKAMSAFENGTFFLLAEQYGTAEVCFRQVTREFPKCYEAWTNLGYALLMQYCDGLDTDDLRHFQIGQLLVGGFYRRPKSLEQETRGIQNKVWEEAVSCFERSLKLKGDQVVTRANLGVAYLVHPDGKPDVAKAGLYLHEAAQNAKVDKSLDLMSLAAILINSSVADFAGSRVEECTRKLDQGEKLGQLFFGQKGRFVVHNGMTSALLYNRAVLMAAAKDQKKQRQAVDLFEEYLGSSNPGGAWWPLAYERYASLCKKLAVQAKAKAKLVTGEQSQRRLVTSVRLSSGVTLAVSEPVAEAVARLGEKLPVVSRSKLARLCYPQHGIEVLATDQVLAIHLVGAKAPALPLREEGLGARPSELRWDMPEAELNRILAKEGYDQRPLDDPKVNYRFYPGLGLAVRIKDARVADLVIAQIPRSRPGS